MSELSSAPDAHELAKSHLFVLRLWQENLGEGQVEWRGKVQHLAHGEAYYFRDWPGLITCLQQILGNQLGPTK